MLLDARLSAIFGEAQRTGGWTDGPPYTDAIKQWQLETSDCFGHLKQIKTAVKNIKCKADIAMKSEFPLLAKSLKVYTD